MSDVPGERGVPAGGAGEYPEILLDGEDHHGRRRGVSLCFDQEDIVKGSGYITAQCSGNSEIELGAVYAAEMGISLFLDIDRYTLEDAEVELSYHLRLASGAYETFPWESLR